MLFRIRQAKCSDHGQFIRAMVDDQPIRTIYGLEERGLSKLGSVSAGVLAMACSSRRFWLHTVAIE